MDNTERILGYKVDRDLFAGIELVDPSLLDFSDIKKLGEGGEGTAYLVGQRGTREKIVIKVRRHGHCTSICTPLHTRAQLNGRLTCRLPRCSCTPNRSCTPRTSGSRAGP